MEPGLLRKQIDRCPPIEQRRLAARFREILAARARGQDVSPQLESLRTTLEACRRRLEARAGRIPQIRYPEDLPVSARRREVADAIRENQVVILCGETGSGKTTQLPKICLEIGRGLRGLIGHTQPRRIAARTVAARIAEELGTPLGALVGYKVRFGDHTSPDTIVKLMTDGILLAETSGDRDLLAYDTILIDEAHERSLNIDFLLGYLKLLLPRRPDLKVIVTSATIDPGRFSAHFGNAPILKVEGRTYPVEVLYRTPHEDDLDERAEEMQSEIVRAVDEAASYGQGDVLVFLSGEREIRETAETLEHHRFSSGPVEILPLFARLSADEQMKVFRPHPGRRVVLATNVAETSLTVPGIRSVVDTGVARISRYAARTKVQRLEVEPVSRASADQRKGRCGRLGPGVCIRLYSEDDFFARPEFTDPEILRTNLASVILQMTALNLGEVESFPFLDPPDSRLIKDGYETLHELGAVDEERKLTPLGKELAKLPIDPRIGRMLLAARLEPSPCLADVLVIASALSVQDPRERPADKQAQADEAHASLRDPRSDFLGFLRLWDWYQDRKRHLSGSRMRKEAKANYLSFIRLREWEEVHNQLAELVGGLGAAEAAARDSRAQQRDPSSPRPARRDERASHGRPPRVKNDHLTHRPPLPPPPESDKPDKATALRVEAIHRALLTGLLSNIGQKNRQEGHKGEYLGARGVRWHIFPGSALFKGGPNWAMAAELVRTTRLYARTVAPIEPAWAERAAGHLVSRSHSDPHWEPRAGRVLAYERVVLFGLELASRRRVHYGPIDLAAAREIFIRAALVDGGMLTDASFVSHNAELIAGICRLQVRSRREHLLADPTRLHAFYAARVPERICTAFDFEKWHDALPQREKKLLFMSMEDATEPGVKPPAESEFPDFIHLGKDKFPLEYRFEAGHAADGVTVRVPLETVGRLPAEPFQWLVPGHLAEKVETILRAIPKDVRKLLPASQTLAEGVTRRLMGEDRANSLFAAIRAAVHAEAGAGVPAVPHEPLERATMPEYLAMRFEVFDAEGRAVAFGRDLAAIRTALAAHLKGSGEVRHGAEKFNRDGITAWEAPHLTDFPERIELDRFGTTFTVFPGIVDRTTSVSLRLFERSENALAETRAGLRRLFLLDAGEEVKRSTHRHPEIERLAVRAAGLGNPQSFRTALVELSVDRALATNTLAPPRNRAEFQARGRAGVLRLPACVREVCGLLEPVLTAYAPVAARLGATHPASWADSVADMRSQLATLLPANFPILTPFERLPHLPRYLAAIDQRIRKLAGSGIIKDRERLVEITPIWLGYHELLKRRAELALDPARVDEYRWLVEELRVSLFAQELKTAVPVSVKRLHDAWERVVGNK